MSLADAVLAVAPLVSQLGRSPRLTRLSVPCPSSVEGLFTAAGLRTPTWVVGSDDISSLDRIVEDRLAVEEACLLDRTDPSASIALARASGIDATIDRYLVCSEDGTGIEAMQSIDVFDSMPVLFVGAPGMPTELHAEWIRCLGTHTQVATWQTRGMFGTNEATPDLRFDRQIEDARAVASAAGFQRYHAVGVCGGATIALALAASDPRIERLSLWFGDFDVGNDDLRTEHQRNLVGLMSMAVAGSISPESMHSMLTGAMQRQPNVRLAPLAVYPFASPSVLSRYCAMNSAVMEADVSRHLDAIDVPTLVVASSDDTTTHLGASQWVAQRIGSAQFLDVQTTGHLSAFADGERWGSMALAFDGGGP